MAGDRCIKHGGDSMIPWGSCPECEILEEHRRIQERASEKAEELARQQSHDREESQRRMEETLEEDRAEREQRFEEEQIEREEAQYRQQEALREAERHQKQNLANAYKLESKSKSDQASELFKAGLIQDSINLANDAISQDPSNIYGHMIMGAALISVGKVDEAKPAFKKVTLLLKTARWSDDAGTHLNALHAIYPRVADLRRDVLSVLEENRSKLPINDNSLQLVKGLIAYRELEVAVNCFSALVKHSSRIEKEWWKLFFKLLSETKGGQLPVIEAVVRQMLDTSKATNQITEFLITMIYTAQYIDSRAISERLASISMVANPDVSVRLIDAFKKIQRGDYGGYEISGLAISREALSLVETIISDVNAKVWSPSLEVVTKRTELTALVSNMKRLIDESKSVTGKGFGVLSSIAWLVVFPFIFKETEVFDQTAIVVIAVLYFVGAVVVGKLPGRAKRSKIGRTVRENQVAIHNIEVRIDQLRTLLKANRRELSRSDDTLSTENVGERSLKSESVLVPDDFKLWFLVSVSIAVGLVLCLFIFRAPQRLLFEEMSGAGVSLGTVSVPPGAVNYWETGDGSLSHVSSGINLSYDDLLVAGMWHKWNKAAEENKRHDYSSAIANLTSFIKGFETSIRLNRPNGLYTYRTPEEQQGMLALAYLYRSLVYSNRGSYEGNTASYNLAIRDLDRYFELAPWDTKSPKGKDKVYLRPDGAALTPEAWRALAHYSRAIIYAEKEDFTSAIVDYTNAIALLQAGPSDLQIEPGQRVWFLKSSHSGRGKAYAKVQRKAESEIDFRMAEEVVAGQIDRTNQRVVSSQPVLERAIVGRWKLIYYAAQGKEGGAPDWKETFAINSDRTYRMNDQQGNWAVEIPGRLVLHSPTGRVVDQVRIEAGKLVLVDKNGGVYRYDPIP